MIRLTLRGVIVCVLAWTLWPAGPAARGQTRPSAEFAGDPRMGVCAHFSQGWDHRKFMPLIAKSGIGWIRDDAWWEGIEKEKGIYVLPQYTREWIKAAHANHIRLLLILNGGNKLYRDKYDPAAFSKWAAWMVKELAGDIDAVEILNEPNNFGFMQFYGGKHEGEGDSPWVAKYVALMNQAAEAVKAVDPRMPVIGFGAGAPVTYKQLQAGTSPAVDAIADHPYSNHSVPELVPSGSPAEQLKRFGFSYSDERGTFASFVTGLANQSAKFHGPKKIWLTEWGFSTYQPLSPEQFSGFTEAAQARYILRRFVDGMGLGVEVSFLYEFKDGHNEHDAEDRFGMVRENGEPKESYQAVANLSAALHGYRAAGEGEVGAVNVFPAASWPQQAPVAIHRFIDAAGHPAVAIWATDRAGGDLQPRVADVELNWGDAGAITATDTLTGVTERVPFQHEGRRLVTQHLILRDYPVLLKAAASAVAAAPGEEQGKLDLFDNKARWGFSDGQEFPGAAGSFAVSADGQTGIGILAYDFTKGGAYVAAKTDVHIPEKSAEFRINARSARGVRLAIQLIDQTGQCHQYIRACSGTGGWETIRVGLSDKPSEFWGGAKDGRIHFPIQSICLAAQKTADEPVGKVEFTGAMTIQK